MFKLSTLNPRNSIRARLLWSIGSLVLLGLLATSLLIGELATGQVREDRGELLAELAYTMADQLDRGVHERLREIRIVASLGTITDASVPAERKRALLERLKSTYANYAWIGFTDARGNILVGTDGLLEGKNVGQRAWFIEGAKGPHVGDVHDAFLLAKILPKPQHDFLPLRLLDISAPIHDADGNLLGVICGHLSWDWSFQVRNALLEPLKAHADTEVVVTNQDGAILLATPGLYKLTPTLNLTSVEAARTGRRGHVVETWPTGASHLTGYARSRGHADYAGLGWVVLVGQPTERAFVAAATLRNVTAVIALGFVLLVGSMLWWLVGRITRPTMEIAAAAQRIREGGSNERLPLFGGRDEAGVLSRSLHALVGSLQDKNERLAEAAQVFDSSTEGIVVTDAEQRILSINAAFSEITGYGDDEILGKTPRVLASGRHDSDFYRAMWAQVHARGKWQGEIWNRRKDGTIYPEWLIVTTVKGANGAIERYIGIFTDITERKRAEQRILFLAQHDGLTELPNRTCYFERLGQALATAREVGERVAVLFVDLDHFKNVNDTLGHEIGDRMLVMVAKRIARAVGADDTVARLGGDEFVVVLPGTDAEQAARAAECIVQAIARPYALDGYELEVTSSIGISLFPDDARDTTTLTRHADMAMFHAKDSGRNRFAFFTVDLDRRMTERMALEAALRVALDNVEMTLAYQPQFDLASGAVVGVEALLRWNHPRIGPVPPARFIPLAEEMGLIDAFGTWALRQACRQTAAWHRLGHRTLRVAVNFSLQQFNDPQLAAKVGAILDQTGLDPAMLEVEITESVLMDSPEEVGRIIGELHAIGVAVAIDDFGTGYSSLAYLTRLRVDVLKIDRSFVAGLADGSDGEALVRTIVEMAHSLRMQVVAEGIEEPWQRAFLKDCGCEVGQGFLLARPLDAEGVTGLLARQREAVAVAES